MAGQGWRMLMECLGAGRAISLPSNTTGGARLGVYTTGAYARVRKQFHLAIAKFDGIDEVLGRMGGMLYSMEAVRTMTAASIDQGEEPAVCAAISKYHVTEMGRIVGNDAMDIHGGKGIQLGPRNYLAPRLRIDTHRHHRGRRQHPDTQPDDLRPGRHPLPSLCAQGDARRFHG